VPDNVWWWVAGAVILVVAIVVIATMANQETGDYDALTGRRRRRRPPRDAFGERDEVEEAPPKRLAVVVNPTKFADLNAVRANVTAVCAAHGWGPPFWFETTVEDPGGGQARAAIAEGAAVVCALGGDGTVRNVANALIGSEVPLGLLPAGTGNLLARNLDLPIDSLERALFVALTGQNKTVDVGRVVIDPALPEGHEAPEGEAPPAPIVDHFLVMAGLGFDATVMADTDEALKQKVGMAAYIVTGLRNMHGPQFKVRVSVDGGIEFTRRIKSVLLGNCGKLFGGLVLMPDSKIDDGLIDAVLLSPKGIVGWTGVAARVLSRQRKGHPIVDHHTGTEIRIRLDRPQEIQLDGDIIGTARNLTTSVVPKSLVVRVAQPS
jgi:diacylglycerol kinase (ATP)